MRSDEAVREAVSLPVTNNAEVYELVSKKLQRLRELIPALGNFKCFNTVNVIIVLNFKFESRGFQCAVLLISLFCVSVYVAVRVQYLTTQSPGWP